MTADGHADAADARRSRNWPTGSKSVVNGITVMLRKRPEAAEYTSQSHGDPLLSGTKSNDIEQRYRKFGITMEIRSVCTRLSVVIRCGFPGT